MRPLFIFEMANNHQGSVEHGKRIIRELKEVCREFEADFDFAVKFQFRDLDTFIHPAYKRREDIKNVKRFMDTRLSMEQFQELYDEVKACGFKAICTPFDEPSVDHIVEMRFDYLKIASCSATDWPLLEKVAQAGLPVIASAAGTDMEDLKKRLTEQKENEAKRTKEDEAIKKIIEKSKMDIPEAMIDTQCETMIEEFAQRIAQSGLTMEQYLQFSGMTIDKLKDQVRPEATTRIQSSLVLEQIAKDENIEVSDADVDAEVEKMAAAYGMEADKLKEYMGDAQKESMKKDIAITKAVELIMDNVKERAKAKKKADPTKKESTEE